MATKAVPAVHSRAPLPVQLCLVHSLVAFQETDEFVEELEGHELDFFFTSSVTSAIHPARIFSAVWFNHDVYP